jgi:hypothetical protein
MRRRPILNRESPARWRDFGRKLPCVDMDMFPVGKSSGACATGGKMNPRALGVGVAICRRYVPIERWCSERITCANAVRLSELVVVNLEPCHLQDDCCCCGLQRNIDRDVVLSSRERGNWRDSALPKINHEWSTRSFELDFLA